MQAEVDEQNIEQGEVSLNAEEKDLAHYSGILVYLARRFSLGAVAAIGFAEYAELTPTLSDAFFRSMLAIGITGFLVI